MEESTVTKKIYLTSVLGNSQRLDGGAMFGNVPRALWSRWLSPDQEGRILLQCRCLLIQTDSQKILLETGIGSYMPPKLKQRFGVESDRHDLLDHLSQIGVEPDDIDVVILSHLHFDHAGGLLVPYQSHSDADDDAKSVELVFNRARFIVGAEAFARSIHPHPRDRASFIPGLSEALQASGRLSLVERQTKASDIGLPSFLEFVYSDGHTPGQMHTLIRAHDRALFFAGDLIPGVAWVHTAVTMGYDRFPEQLIDEKTSVYQRALDEHWSLFFTHDPDVALAELSFDADKRRFFATNESKELKHTPWLLAP